MKPAKFGSYAVVYGFSLCCAFAQSPAVLTPGTSTESVEVIGTGTRTTFTLTGNTILSWEQLNLAQGSELVYDFVSGDRVLNLLSGSNRHTIDGTVTSNGIVAFFSPNANFDMNGSISAKGVVLSTLNADADEFFSGNGYALNGGSGINRLLVGGVVTATGGDVVIAGPIVDINWNTVIDANGSVLVGGGSNVAVSESGSRKLSVSSANGEILNMGAMSGSVIELVAGGSASNEGTIDAGTGQIFIEVGQGMQITNESNGVIIADDVFTNETITEGVVITPDEGDSAPVVSEGTLNVPELTRPDGTIVTVQQKVSANAPVSASGDIGRDAATKNTKGTGGGPGTVSGSGQVASNRGATNSLLRRSSFFGVRGGGKTVSTR